MLRKILSIALIVVGLVVIGLAIASATVWRDSETVTATSVSADPAVPLLVTAPGVLDLVASDVTIRAFTPEGQPEDSPVVLAVGREVDVTGWVGDAKSIVIDRLASWTELTGTVNDGPADLPSPAGSDMWVAEATGAGEATLEWSDAPGRWSAIAASDGTGPAPRLSLTWQREVSTPFLIPGLVVGGILLLAGVALGVVAMRARQVPELVLDRDAIRERLGAVPPRRKAGRHAHGTRPLDTYSGTELAGGGATVVGAEGLGSAEAAPEAAPPAAELGEGEADEADEPDVTGVMAEFDESVSEDDEDEATDEAAPEAAPPAAELEEGEADEADEPDVPGVMAEFDDSTSEDDEDDEDDEWAAPADDTNPKGEKA